MKAIPYRDHLIVPVDPRLAVMVPHAKTFMHDGQQMMLIPHKVDETQVLRNLGYDVRPPVMMNYNWPGPEPFDAQRLTTALITTHRRSFVFNGLGTGKTRSALYAYDFLKQTTPGLGSMIVVAPLATLRQVWEREVTLIFPHLTCRVLHGTKQQRLKLLDEPADIYIINHDGVETIILELIARMKRFSMATLDELSAYKNARTDLWKKTYRLVSEIDRVAGMTATPMPLAATDAYGQIKMLLPAALGGKSFSRFREMVQTKVSEFRWVNKRGAVEDVYKLMQPSVRFSRDECYDMPPCQQVTWETTLPKEAANDFQKMATEGAIERLGIKAANAADEINKMLQISLGAVYLPDGSVHKYDISNREKLLHSAIEQSASKVIVFTPYKHTLEMINQSLFNYFTARGSISSVAVVSGDVPNNKREQIYTQFMHAPDPQVLVAHPACMSHGLTLTEASTIVWWGPPNSLEVYEQANGRITRAGQRHSQLIINLVATRMELKMFKLLEKRANVQQVLLDMFERQDKKDLL